MHQKSEELAEAAAHFFAEAARARTPAEAVRARLEAYRLVDMLARRCEKKVAAPRQKG